MTDLFKDTYNALYLKGLSSQKITEIKSNSNPVQKRLIDNLLRKKHSYDVKFIEGPIGIRKYKLEKPKKSIYLFGERHFETKGQCKPHRSIEFVEYIKRLAKETPAFFDIYVETPIVTSTINSMPNLVLFRNAVKSMYRKRIKFPTAYKLNMKKTPPKTVGYMFRELRKEFRECIEPATRKNNSKCELFRFHYVDIRATWDITDDISIYKEDTALHIIYIIFSVGLQAGKNSQEIIDVLRRINKHCPSILNMLKMLILPNGELNLIDIFCKSKIYKKQLDASYKKEEIKSFLKIISEKKIEFSSVSKNEFIKGINDLISSIENKTEMDIEFIKKTPKLFLKLNDMILDTYCISRIFKIHKMKGEFQPAESKNIIIYVGDAHGRNISEFLGYIGFKPTFSFYNDDEKSCVNMKESNQYIPQRSPQLFKSPKKKSPKKKSPKIPLDLQKLKVKELISLAKQLGLKGYSKLTKDKLINLIQSPYSPTKELKKLNVKELKNLAKNLNLKGYSKMKKDDLIKILKK